MGELDRQLDELLRLSPEVAKVHHLKYLNYMHHKDYSAAVDSLHRYFDYSACQNPPGGEATLGKYPSGVLSLGALHGQLGHVREALHALSEAIKLAHMSNDSVCLAHSLATLCHILSNSGSMAGSDWLLLFPSRGFSKARNPVFTHPGEGRAGGPTDDQRQLLLLLLRRCLRRAVELRLPHIVAFGRLALAQFEMQHIRRLPRLGGRRSAGPFGTLPSEICKSLRLSAHLHNDAIGVASILPPTTVSSVLKASMAVGVSTSYGAGLHLSLSGSLTSSMVGSRGGSTAWLGPVAESVVRLAGSSHLLRATCWELYGSLPLVRAEALVHATCYRDVASANDMCLSYVKLISHLTTHKGYGPALAALRVAARNFPLQENWRLEVARLELLHDRALHRGELCVAELASSELAALTAPAAGIDLELKVEATIRQIRTLIASNAPTKAAKEAKRMFHKCHRNGLQLESIRLLLLIAEAHKKARSVTDGLPYVLSCMTLCDSFGLDLLRAEAAVTLGEMLYALGPTHAAEARDVLQQSLVIILGHGSLDLRMRVHLALSRAHLAILTLEEFNAAPDEVLDMLSTASDDAQKIEAYGMAADISYLQAMIFNQLGRMQERNVAASAFWRSTVAHENAKASRIAVLPL